MQATKQQAYRFSQACMRILTEGKMRDVGEGRVSFVTHEVNALGAQFFFFGLLVTSREIFIIEFVILLSFHARIRRVCKYLVV